jgi:hypothetical protein
MVFPAGAYNQRFQQEGIPTGLTPTQARDVGSGFYRGVTSLGAGAIGDVLDLFPTQPNPLMVNAPRNQIASVFGIPYDAPPAIAPFLQDRTYNTEEAAQALTNLGVIPQPTGSMEERVGEQLGLLPYLAGSKAIPDALDLAIGLGARGVREVGAGMRGLGNVLEQPSASDQVLGGGSSNVLEPQVVNPFDRLQSPELAEAALGQYKTTTAGRIMNMTKKQKGYTVNLNTGDTVDVGKTHAIMMGTFRNSDPRNSVIDGPITRKAIEEFAEKNKKVLAKEGNYLGTWYDADANKTYLDVSKRYGETKDEVRKATKFGERTEQKAGFKISTGEETPVGNWKNFIRGVAGKNADGTDIPDTEFNDRLLEMEALGQRVLRESGIDDWYDVQGWTDIYGKENIEQIAGFISTTSANTKLEDNVRITTEYLRRFIKGEDIVQPDYRLTAGGPTGVGFKTGMGEAGTVLNMETNRVNNLKVSASGELHRLSEASGNEKVKSFAQNIANVKDRATLDTYYAQIAENPNRGIFTNAQHGQISPNNYKLLEQEVAKVAKERNPTAKNPIRKFSAEVWTGIRRKIAETGELYGVEGKRIGTEGNYNTVLEELIKEKAGFLDIPVKKFKQMLADGDANLLSLMLTSPIIYQSYQHYERDIEQPAIGQTTNPLNAGQSNVLSPSA